MADVSLFLHSTGTSPSMWDGVPTDVFASTDKLAPCNLGYPPRPPLARGQMCRARDDAQAALSQLPIAGDVHIFAHSYGSVIALELLASLGQRVRSLFLFEPVMFSALAAEVRGTFPDWFLTDTERGGTDEWLALFIDYWNRPGSWARSPDPMKAYLRASGWKMFMEVRSCFNDVTSFTQFPLPDVPCTLVTAERSPAPARAMVQGLAAAHPWARVVELTGTGHMAPLTHPGLVHAAMREHVARCRQG